ncbi:hypothetical protein TIFTF001_056539 [Ficus carica]|uniref:Uncharacterized protein n=2 Tax=Ficus carica TaxID=3494 RepID=A0AA88ENE8_FICCA|nr:hypothetical protein TIFTF001_056539 [Ficus carica]
MTMLNLALLCTNPSPTLRPPMSSVVKMLEGKIPVQAPVVSRRTFGQSPGFKAFESLRQGSQTDVSEYSHECHDQACLYMDGSSTGSSVTIKSKDGNRDNPHQESL